MGETAQMSHAALQPRRLIMLNGPQDEDAENMPSMQHLDNMNSLGHQVAKLHNMWLKMKMSGYRKGFSLQKTTDEDEHKQAILSVIDIFDRIKMLHLRKMQLLALSRTGTCGCFSKLTLKQIEIRAPLMWRGYFRDPWNVVDIINYLVFLQVAISSPEQSDTHSSRRILASRVGGCK